MLDSAERKLLTVSGPRVWARIRSLFSIHEALRHAAWAHDVDVKVRWGDKRGIEIVTLRTSADRARPAEASR